MSWGVDVIYVIYNSLWYSYFFGALLLIGLAWGISRKGMGWIEAGVFIAVEVVFYVTWVINFALEGYYVVRCSETRLSLQNLRPFNASAPNPFPSSTSL
jgi:hypothetical protein